MVRSLYQDLPRIPIVLSIQSDPLSNRAQQGTLHLSSRWLLPGSGFGPCCPASWTALSYPSLAGCLIPQVTAPRPWPPPGPCRASLTSLGVLQHTYPCLTSAQFWFICLCLPTGWSHEAGTFSVLVHPQHPAQSRPSVHTQRPKQCSLPRASGLQGAELALKPRTSSSLCKLHGQFHSHAGCLLSGTILCSGDPRMPLSRYNLE